MRKSIALVLVLVFVVSLLIGMMVSPTQAKPPKCYYKCMNGLLYRCCIIDGVEGCNIEPKGDCIR